jgi:hypothetical protein
MASREATATSWAHCNRTKLSKIKSTATTLRAVPGLEPTSPHYGCGILPLDHQCLSFSVGPDGLEPSPTWLRARYAAANTSIPLSSLLSSLLADQSARRESNPRSGPYKRPALTAELRAVSGAGGIRTLTLPLKRRMRCRYATAPRGAGVCVSAEVVPTSLCSLFEQ